MVAIPISADISALTAGLNEIRQAIERSGQAAADLAKIDLSHPELRDFARDIGIVQQRVETLVKTGRGETATAARTFYDGSGVNLFGPSGLLTGGLQQRYPNPTQAQNVQNQAVNYIVQGTSFQQAAVRPPDPFPTIPPPPGGWPTSPPGMPSPLPVAPGGVRPPLPPGVLPPGALPPPGWPSPPPTPPPVPTLPAPPRPPRPAPAPAPGPGAPPGAPPGGGGFPGGITGQSIIGPILGMVGIGSLGAMAVQAFEAAKRQDVAIDTLIRRINDSGTDFERLRTAIAGTVTGLGITSIEATRLATTWSRMTGDTAPDAVLGGARLGAGFARSFGLDPDQATSGLGRAQMLGQDPRQFALLIGEAVARGNQSGQTDQVMSTLIRALDAMTRGAQPGFTGYAGLYADLNASANPALRGVNAAGVIDTISGTLAQGGGAGMASQLFTMQAFAREGVRNPYSVQGRLEEGIFSPVREGGPTVLQTELAELNRQYGGLSQSDPDRFRHIVERQFGVRMPVVQALQGVFGSNLSGLGGGGGLGVAGRRLSEAGVDINAPGFNPTSIQDLVNISSAEDPATLQGYRQRLLGGKRLSTSEKSELTDAPDDQLRNVLLRDYAKYGQDETEGSRLRQAMTDLETSLVKVGGDFVPAITGMTIAAGKLTEAIHDLFEWLKAHDPFGPTPETAEDMQNQYEGGGSAPGGGGGATGFGGWFNRTITGSGAPSGGPLEHITGAMERQRISEAIDFYQSPEGGSFPRNAALGIVAGHFEESGMGRTSQNIPQWTDAARRASIERHMGKPIAEMSFHEQLVAHAWELTEGPEKPAGDALRNATSPYDAGYKDTTLDMRPSLALLRGIGRGERARQFDQDFPASGAGRYGGAGLQAPRELGTLRVDPFPIVLMGPTGDVYGQRDLPMFIIPPSPNNAGPDTSTAPAGRHVGWQSHMRATPPAPAPARPAPIEVHLPT